MRVYGEPWRARWVTGTVTVCCFAVAALCGSTAWANITLTGNINGNPAKAKDPPVECPAHHTAYCQSILNPTAVTLKTDTSDWFRQVLEKACPASEKWRIHYMGGNTNMNGTFNVNEYAAYNECPAWMGAGIDVSFVPDPKGSLISDVLWISALKWNFRCFDETKLDDKAFLVELGNLKPTDTVMPGPFYPYQDEDVNPVAYPDGLQTAYAPSVSDNFKDYPNRECPPPGTLKYARFETHAAWWDDFYLKDGTTIYDADGDGYHDLYIHEGFLWGVDLICVPVPSAVVLCLIGLGLVERAKRRYAAAA